MVKVGDKIRFVPGGLTDSGHEVSRRAVTGTVSWVNEAHRTYGVEAELGSRGYRYRETFKF